MANGGTNCIRYGYLSDAKSEKRGSMTRALLPLSCWLRLFDHSLARTALTASDAGGVSFLATPISEAEVMTQVTAAATSNSAVASNLCLVMALTGPYGARVMAGEIVRLSSAAEASAKLPPVFAQALPTAVVVQLEEHAAAARGTMSTETVRAWAKAWGAFSGWVAGQALAVLPATAGTVAAYVDSLTESGRAPASIRQAVWAIGKMHRAAGLDDPSKAEVVRLALKRMVRAAGARQRQAAPLVDDDVRLAIRAAGPSPSLSVRRDLAMLMVMRDLLARRSEAVALDVSHLAFAADGSATVLIARSKTDQEGQGEVRWLSPRTVTHLRRWLDGAGIKAGAVFRSVNKGGGVGDRLTTRDVSRILKRVAELAGLEASGISGHSCRVGMAQDLAAEGAELPAIMQAGWWKSPAMPARYAERMIAGRGAVAKFYERRKD